jgi:hypothetical protein
MLWLLLLTVLAQTDVERKLKGCLVDWEVYAILTELFSELAPEEAETLTIRFMQHIDSPTVAELEGWIRNFDIVEFAEMLSTSEASIIASQLQLTLPEEVLAEPHKYGFTRETREALNLDIGYKLAAIENGLATLSEEQVAVTSAPQLSNFVYAAN